MEKESTLLKYDNQPNNFQYTGENIKKEKSLKSNYSNSSSVETQYDKNDNSQQKNESDSINKDRESVNEVTTLINYNLSRKYEKSESQTIVSSFNKVTEASSELKNNQIITNIKESTISPAKVVEQKNSNISSIEDMDDAKKGSIVNSNPENEKDSSIDSVTSSVVYSYSLSTKTLTPKLKAASSKSEMNIPSIVDINTKYHDISKMPLSTPQTSTPKTPKMASFINNTSYFSSSPVSAATPSCMTPYHNKIFELKENNNNLLRSESSPSILKTDPNAKSINISGDSSLKTESQLSNLKNKSLLNRLRKKEVIKELMESERLYVSDLQMLIENCFNPLEAVSWLPLNEKCLLIRNIQELFAFQQEFLEDMELSVKDLKEKLADDSVKENSYTEEEMDKVMNECVRSISDCFIRRKKKFKVYSEFCSLHQEAINIFREYERKPEMISFIRDFNGKTHSRLHLQDFLIKPVQRICKYPLLLKELIHYSDENCEEINGLKEALTVMSEVAREIDHVKWLIERVQRTDKFVDRLDIQDQFKYIIMKRYGDMILSTGLEVVMEKERVNYRGVFLFRKHMFIVKPKRSKNYRVKMHLILDEFYFQAYPESNCFRLIQKNTGIIIDFFAFSTVESKVWIELMETLVEPLEEIADKNKIFYIKAKNSYESHFSRFSLELKTLNNSSNQKNNNLRRAASSSLVNSNLEPLRPIDPSLKFTKRDSLQSCTSIDKKDSIDSYNSCRTDSKSISSQGMGHLSNDLLSFNSTPKINPIQTSTSLKSQSLTDKTENQGTLSTNKSLICSANTVKLNSLKNKNSGIYTGTNGTISSTLISSTVETEVSSNGSEMFLFENPIMDHELVISEPGVINETAITPKHLVSEPEYIKGAIPKKLDLISDTVNKTDNLSSTINLPPKYKLIDSKFYDVYTYLFTNNDIQKIFSNLMYRSHEFDHLLYHKKTARSRSNSCPRERYIFRSSKDRKDKDKLNSNYYMSSLDDKNSSKSDNRSSLYISIYNNDDTNNFSSDSRSIKSSRSSVNLYHLSEEAITPPPPPNIFKHTKNNSSYSSVRKTSSTIPDDASVNSFNSVKYRKRHSISIFKSNTAPSQILEPTRTFIHDSQIVVVDSPSSRCYSSLTDKMIDQDINFYFETIQQSPKDSNDMDGHNLPPSLDTHSIKDHFNSNPINKTPTSYRKTIAIMDVNTLNNLQKYGTEDDAKSISKASTEDSLDTSSVNEDNNSSVSYYQNRHSLAIDQKRMETHSRTYGKVKNKKDKRVLFGNIKKIFTSSTRHGSSSSSTSTSALPKYNSRKDKSYSNYILPKYSSESNLNCRLNNAIRSPNLSPIMNKFSKSECDVTLSSIQSPLLRIKSPLAEHVVNNLNSSGQEFNHNKENNSTLGSSITTPIESSLFEEEDASEFSSINSMNSMDHLNKDSDIESDIGIDLHFSSIKDSSPITPIKVDNSELMEKSKTGKYQSTIENHSSTSNISPHYKTTQSLNSPSSPYYRSSPISTLNKKSSELLNKASHMSESYNSNTSNISNISHVQNRSFNSLKSNTSVNSNKTNKSSSSSVVKKFYLDQKDIVIPYPDKKPTSLNSISSNESMRAYSPLSKFNKHTTASSSINEQDSFISLNNSNTSHLNDKFNGDASELPHLNIIEETRSIHSNEDDDSDLSKDVTKNFTTNSKESNDKVMTNITVNTSHLNHSASNSTLSSNQSNINSASSTPNSSRPQLKKNKTISLKLINLKKIF
ncbi:hypothetical protein BCR36DRAFT_579489 [Piromyces finnis]|uniref:DH domain-containing protein n=1 Tax=Piromyces finnis TaxID=1754191 RepID=A0A1Y1VMP3_9FUNG|nr:hypothetical protein BCR36DRAFT_579489 [Piromyces finnis]|eukprot:ORX60049.1 hypothetical protein BCR36DRAFT_579489 [Piromyces finnis]